MVYRYSRLSHIWTVTWRYFYLNISFTQWCEEANNLVRNKTESARFIGVFSNRRYFVGKRFLLWEIEDCWLDRLSYDDEIWGSCVRNGPPTSRQVATLVIFLPPPDYFQLRALPSPFMLIFCTPSLSLPNFVTFYMPGGYISVEGERGKILKTAKTSLIAFTLYKSTEPTEPCRAPRAQNFEHEK